MQLQWMQSYTQKRTDSYFLKNKIIKKVKTPKWNTHGLNGSKMKLISIYWTHFNCSIYLALIKYFWKYLLYRTSSHRIRCTNSVLIHLNSESVDHLTPLVNSKLDKCSNEAENSENFCHLKNCMNAIVYKL